MLFAVFSDARMDRLPSANAGMDVMFWEQLVSLFFLFSSCLKAAQQKMIYVNSNLQSGLLVEVTFV